MQTYYFNVDDGRQNTDDPDGVAFSSEDDARRAAVRTLKELVTNELPEHEDRSIRIVVRDEEQRPMFECAVDFTVRRLK